MSLLTSKTVDEAASEGKVSKAWVLRKLYELVEGEGVASRDRLAALKLIGDHLAMFVQKKQVNIDINSMVRSIPESELKAISGEVLSREALEGEWTS